MFNKYLSGNLHPVITFIVAWLVPQVAGALIAWNANTLFSQGVLEGLNIALLYNIILVVTLVLTAFLIFPYWRSIQSNSTYKWLGWLGLAFLGAVLAVGVYSLVKSIYISYLFM